MEKIEIKILGDYNCDYKKYVKWINDTEVMQYTSSGLRSWSIDDAKDYIIKINESQNDFLFSIVVNGEFIGTMKIGFINWINRTCELGLIIGEKNYWRKGIGKNVIKLGVEYAFNNLNIYKVKAGIISKNLPSYKAFIRNDFKEVGRWEKEFFINEKRYDHILLEKIRKIK